MVTSKGWFIRTKEPNTLFWSLEPDYAGGNGWVTNVEHALLFARKRDAELYYQHQFHPSVRADYEVAGIN